MDQGENRTYNIPKQYENNPLEWAKKSQTTVIYIMDDEVKLRIDLGYTTSSGIVTYFR